jgi:ABC-type multidrug transport system fused ATPase/permease subunit
MVINQGTVAEMGSHEELIGAGKLYAALYAAQFKHSEKPAQV